MTSRYTRVKGKSNKQAKSEGQIWQTGKSKHKRCWKRQISARAPPQATNRGATGVKWEQDHSFLAIAIFRDLQTYPFYLLFTLSFSYLQCIALLLVLIDRYTIANLFFVFNRHEIFLQSPFFSSSSSFCPCYPLMIQSLIF